MTHPAVVAALCRLLAERGAAVTVGDSPGGTWSAGWLNVVYNACGIRAVEAEGAALNRDFSQEEVVFPDAVVLKSFPFTSWLRGADAVIDCCKLKTHGFASMSAAVKNLFGVIPGTRKPEYHYLQQSLRGFSDLLVDINEYIKPRLTVVDAVECMEGNGPTQGTPRHMGALLCASSTYAADLVCAPSHRPLRPGTCRPWPRPSTGASARRASMRSVYSVIPIPLPCRTLKNSRRGTAAVSAARHPLIGRFLEKAFGSGPPRFGSRLRWLWQVRRSLPQPRGHAEKSRAVIDGKACIRCFCCQEFCPAGAVTVHRPLLARLLGN